VHVTAAQTLAATEKAFEATYSAHKKAREGASTIRQLFTDNQQGPAPWQTHMQNWETVFDFSASAPDADKCADIACGYGIDPDIAREIAEDFIDQRGPCKKPTDATDGTSTPARRSSRINGPATTDGFRTPAKRAAGGFFKEILCQLSPGCVYTKVHHNKKVADKIVVCTCRGAAGVKACARDLVTFEHGSRRTPRLPCARPSPPPCPALPRPRSQGPRAHTWATGAHLRALAGAPGRTRVADCGRATCRYVIKTDNPSRFFEIKGVWADPAMALEFGSMYLCCKNCNNAADKAGATNIQMCLYQDLVEARAALADQAP